MREGKTEKNREIGGPMEGKGEAMAMWLCVCACASAIRVST